MFSRFLVKQENKLIDEIASEKNLFRKLSKAYKLNALLIYMANNNA